MHSIKKRYIIKFSSNLLSAGINSLLFIKVAKELGISDYGNYEYVSQILAVFLATILLNFPQAIFTLVSQKLCDENFKSYIAIGSRILVLLIASLFITLFFASYGSLYPTLFPGIDRSVFIQGLVFSFLIYIQQYLSFLYDAKGKTLAFELYRTSASVSRLLALFIVGMDNNVTIEEVFRGQSIALVLTNIIPLYKLSTFSKLNDQKQKLTREIISFWKFYSTPLLFYSVIGFISEGLDRWMIQKFYGSFEQGSFQLSAKIGSIIFLFSASMTQIFGREIAVSFGQNNFDRLRNLFYKTRFFFYITSGLSAFAIVNIEGIIKLSTIPMDHSKIGMLQIMLLFPIHQTIGQLAGIFFNSTNRNKIYSVWGTAQILSSIIITYFLIAPSSNLIPGLNLGAWGVAFKMVALQFIGTNVLTYINCKFLNVRFSDNFLYQLIILALCFLMGILTKLVAEFLTSSNLNLIIVSLGLYSTALVITSFAFPKLVGLKNKS